MGQGTPQVFTGITPLHYARLTEKAKGAGIDLGGNAGSATKFGVEVAWKYVPETQELTLHTLETPFFVKPEDVDARIRAMVKESIA